MLIFPAIDLIDEKVVRLFQGDYAKQETYGEDPVAFAAEFEKAGAAYLHLVDLDGAKAGSSCNFAVAKKIVEQTSLLVELGGGIRDEKAVERCFEAGIGRAILGTSALKNPIFTKNMVEKYGDKIAIGIDARDGKVAVEGWLSTSSVDSFAFCKEMQEIGVKHIIYTDIARDGAGRGVNLHVYEQLAELNKVHITASGGVTDLNDVENLKKMNVYAAIIGKALYTGAVKLEEAIKIAGPQK